MTANFDTLTYSKNLTKAGEKPEIAEVHALALKQLADQNAINEKLEPLEKKIDNMAVDVAVLKSKMTMIKWMIGGIGFGVFLLVVKTFLS